MGPEKQIEKQILLWLNYQPGIFAVKINNVGVYDLKKKIYRKNLNPFIPPGVSDIMGCFASGRMFAMEVKTPVTIQRFIHRPTAHDQRQRNFLERIARVGGLACVVGSLQEAIDCIQKPYQYVLPWLKTDIKQPN